MEEDIFPVIIQIDDKWKVKVDKDTERVFDTQEQVEDYLDSYYDDYGDNMTDVEADADTLKSVGWGTDEDYNGWSEENL